jgi:hypothetical protein
MSNHVPIAKSIDSTRALWLLLTCAVERPEQASTKLIAACATQVTLSRFRDASNNIIPLSLNTLKGAARIAIESGGWETLDSLRRKVALLSLASKKQNQRPARGLRQQLENRIKENFELNKRVQELLRGRTLLLSAYMDAIEMLKTHTSLSPALSERLVEHESIFDIRALSNARI